MNTDLFRDAFAKLEKDLAEAQPPDAREFLNFCGSPGDSQDFERQPPGGKGEIRGVCSGACQPVGARGSSAPSRKPANHKEGHPRSAAPDQCPHLIFKKEPAFQVSDALRNDFEAEFPSWLRLQHGVGRRGEQATSGRSSPWYQMPAIANGAPPLTVKK